MDFCYKKDVSVPRRKESLRESISSEGKGLLLTQFLVKWETQPTSVQSWSKHYSPFANKWNNLFKNISKMSADSKLRQFSFKLLHRILVTKKELKRYKIKLDDECFFLQKSRFSRTHISGLLCRRGLLLRNDDMVQQRTEIPL